MKFRLLNSNFTVGNSKSWPRALNLMAPSGLSFIQVIKAVCTTVSLRMNIYENEVKV